MAATLKGLIYQRAAVKRKISSTLSSVTSECTEVELKNKHDFISNLLLEIDEWDSKISLAYVNSVDFEGEVDDIDDAYGKELDSQASYHLSVKKKLSSISSAYGLSNPLNP